MSISPRPERHALLRALLAAVGVDRESALVARMHRRFALPGPAAELRAAVVGDRFVDLRLGIHDERTVLHHALADRAALQQEDLGFVGSVLEKDVARRLEARCMASGDRRAGSP